MSDGVLSFTGTPVPQSRGQMVDAPLIALSAENDDRAAERDTARRDRGRFVADLRMAASPQSKD
jgi:hypothetical protein